MDDETRFIDELKQLISKYEKWDELVYNVNETTHIVFNKEGLLFMQCDGNSPHTDIVFLSNTDMDNILSNFML